MLPTPDLTKTPADLTPLEAAEVLSQLAEVIAYHNERYHGEDNPEISDQAFDQLVRYNSALEDTFPQLVQTQSSPNQKVGAKPNAAFGKITHALAMLSLSNAFDDEDVTDFIDRIKRFLSLPETDEVALTAEPKIDGLSLSLRYEDGVLISAATRGDGTTGEDVTANILATDSIPKKLNATPPALLEVRGELYMDKADFIALNQAQDEKGAKLFANPRNAAAGSLRQKDASITGARAKILCL